MHEVRKSQNQDLRPTRHGVWIPGRWSPIPETFLASGIWGERQAFPAWRVQRYCDPQLMESSIDRTTPCWPAWCAPGCKAMEFAETGHRREARPDLPVNLLMLLHALRLVCEKSVELTASSHRSCFCWSRDSRTKWLYQSQSPLGLGWRSDRGSHTFCPSMAHNSSGDHVGYIV